MYNKLLLTMKFESEMQTARLIDSRFRMQWLQCSESTIYHRCIDERHSSLVSPNQLENVSGSYKHVSAVSSIIKHVRSKFIYSAYRRPNQREGTPVKHIDLLLSEVTRPSCNLALASIRSCIATVIHDMHDISMKIRSPSCKVYCE